MPHVAIPHSHHAPVVGSEPLGPVHPDEMIQVTVRLKPSHPLPDAGSIVEGRGMLNAEHAPRLIHCDLVGKMAAQFRLGWSTGSPDPFSIIFSGRACELEKAFGVTLEHHAHPDGGTYRTHSGPVHVPEYLRDVITGVFGLDDRPVAKPHYRLGGRPVHAWREFPGGGHEASVTRQVPPGSFTPTQLATLYDFPAGDGAGQTIAIIELGGGFTNSDLKHYFKALDLPMPSVSAVSVDHGKNRPTRNPDGPDGEVMLDIEVAAAIAPKAKIVVYFAPNTDRGFLDAITTAIHDTINKPSVVSISWGGPESNWTGSAVQAMDEAFQAAAALGVTVTVAAGDNGSSDGLDDGQNHVDFPASSPHVLACGGTTLHASAGKIDSEVVWNEGDGGATGGGVSDVFPAPSYQAGLAAMRGVPDVAAVADPATGYFVRVDGHDTVIGGTSACSPLLAGLVARLNQALGRNVGFLNPTLYANPSVFRDIKSGNNGAFAAGLGWDACTGLGVVDGSKLLAVLKSKA